MPSDSIDAIWRAEASARNADLELHRPDSRSRAMLACNGGMLAGLLSQ
jgi:hypothetical protein